MATSQTSTRTKAMVITLLLIVFGLALTPVIASSLVDAAYGINATDTFTKAAGAGVTKVCTLSHGNLYAGAHDTQANATHVTVTTNQSGYTVAWSVTSLGSYSANASITLTGLTNGTRYLITVVYYYELPAVEVALLNIVPILWVVIILAVGVVAIYIEIKRID
jgi:hypothetical protein